MTTTARKIAARIARFAMAALVVAAVILAGIMIRDSCAVPSEARSLDVDNSTSGNGERGADIRLDTSGNDRAAPFVVVLHGRGSTPTRMARFWSRFDGKADVVFLQAPIPERLGWKWFEWDRDTSDDELGARLVDADAKLWPTIAKLAEGRTPIVVGFSQGAMMAFTLACRHSDDVKLAFPIAGFLPRSLLPKQSTEPTKCAPIRAWHGTKDNVIDVALARETVASLRAAGVDATLTEEPELAHRHSKREWEAVFAAIRAHQASAPATTTTTTTTATTTTNADAGSAP